MATRASKWVTTARVLGVGAIAATLAVTAVPGSAHAGNGNDATITVTKTVLPASYPNWSIQIVVTDDEGDPVGSQPVTEADPEVVFNVHSVDGPFTVSEILPPGWTQNGSPDCYNSNPPGPARMPHTPAQAPPEPGVVDLFPGATYTCDFDNLAPPRVTFQKITYGGFGDPFQFEVSDGETGADKDVYDTKSITTTQAGIVQPATPTGFDVPTNTPLQVEEILPSGWLYFDSTCTEYGPSGSVQSTRNGLPFQSLPELESGDELRCIVSNVKAATVSVTKTVVGGTPWSFDFELRLPKQEPGEGTILTATNQNPTVTFTNVEPTTEYVVMEVPQNDYTEGTMVCTGDTWEDDGPSRTPHQAPRGIPVPEGPSDNITVGPGDVVTCNITNTDTRITDLQIIKTPDVLDTTLDGTVVWNLEVKNISAVTAANVEVNDTLPSELDLVSVTPPAGWDCSGSNNGTPAVVNCFKASMAAGETAVFSVATKVVTLIDGEIVNTAHVGTSTPELSLANNNSTARVLAGELPATGGSSPWRPLLVGSLLAGLGGLALLAVRRRRVAL